MKRSEILSRLGFTVAENRKKRVILISDIHCEADDPFAIMQHLLTPSFEVKGIVACHYEWQARIIDEMLEKYPERAEAIKNMPPEMKPEARGESRDLSYEEGKLILQLAEIDDVPLLKGAQYEITDRSSLPESEGADFIIAEALKDDPMPLYVCTLGAQTDLGIALLKCPEIAERLTAVCILGAPYPDGGWEFNCLQDVEATNAILESKAAVWQIPMNVYRDTQVSFAELADRIRPCGALGKWMVDQMFDFYARRTMAAADGFPHPEVWSIGDNPTAGALLQSDDRAICHMANAPHINPDGTYTENPDGKEIRVYDDLDHRLTIFDLMAKMHLCYGGK